jgi:hypothetical protein
MCCQITYFGNNKKLPPLKLGEDKSDPKKVQKAMQEIIDAGG